MNEQKIKNLLGLAQRARLLVSGSFAVEETLKVKKVKMLLVTTDASDSTFEKFEKISSAESIPLIKILTKESLAQCLGKDLRSVAAILDAGFKKSIEKILDG